jgi:hypothetical protein
MIDFAVGMGAIQMLTLDGDVARCVPMGGGMRRT